AVFSPSLETSTRYDLGQSATVRRLESRTMLINRTSLSRTVDAINAALFDGRVLAASERAQAARWIAERQGLPGAYGGTFASFPAEGSNGIVLFTGERIGSASARHIVGEEASRVLRLLVLALTDIDSARARAELHYAAPALERAASRAEPSAVHGQRRW